MASDRHNQQWNEALKWEPLNPKKKGPNPLLRVVVRPALGQAVDLEASSNISQLLTPNY